MYQMLRPAIAAVVIYANFSGSALAQVAATQIKLTEKQVEGFIAAQKDMSAAGENVQGVVLSDQAKAKYKSELNSVTKKHGFRDFAEYQSVAANISMVMEAIDPQTKVFIDPQAAIQKELERVSADKTITGNEKKKLLRELNEAMKSVESVQFPTNVELVKKYYDQIEVTAIAAHEGDSHPTSSVVRTTSE
jgi:hypothetical protein